MRATTFMCSTCGRRAFGPRLPLARFPPVPMLGAVASYRRGGPRPPVSRGASNMSTAPALHHFIKTLGLLRQLGEIDEVVPLLRHDQDSPLAV